ncbi:MAG: CinA family protein [Chloroflexi bacterium]|nr:CinA family protein [Chloroflexota bacterium]MCL5107845.1 CinA family protein [Chloroflexota bacterium]
MELQELGSTLVDQLAARGLTLAVAESCTGGLLGDTVTNVPGSSRVFLGGVLAYADQVKQNVLGVPREALAQHGAVSAQVALAMARGARRALGADLAVATTGVAGPSGGTPAKPVGLVYVAVAGPWGEQCRRHRAGEERLANKRNFAQEALGLLLEYIETDGNPEHREQAAG